MKGKISKSNGINYKDNIIKKIRGFCFVMKYKSITKAAKFLYLSQPAISFQIKSLEKDLKLTLFKKEKNKIIPTEDAHRFYNFAKNILSDFENIYNNFLKLDSDLHQNELRIAGSGDYLSNIGVSFLKQYEPRKEIKIKFMQIEKDEELIDLLNKDFVDIVGVREEVMKDFIKEGVSDVIEVRKDFKVYGMLINKKKYVNQKNKDIVASIKNIEFIYNYRYNEKIKFFFQSERLKKGIFLDTENEKLMERLVEENNGSAIFSYFKGQRLFGAKNKNIKFIKISNFIKKDCIVSICKKNSFFFKNLAPVGGL